MSEEKPTLEERVQRLESQIIKCVTKSEEATVEAPAKEIPVEEATEEVIEESPAEEATEATPEE